MKVAILGAGIAGLSTAYLLKQKHAHQFTLFEESNAIGGMAKTFTWHDFQCDLAPHRLFTNQASLLEEFLALVPMNKIRRRSRIFIQGKWIRDPVNAVEIVAKFFPGRSASIVYHYLVRRQYPETSFNALALNKFGKGLNEFFFKPYSEKLFGIPADQISPHWGRQKIRVGGIADMIRRNSKLYFSYFYYPKQHGYGAICNRLYQDVRPCTRLNTRLTNLRYDPTARIFHCTFNQNGQTVHDSFDTVVSSLPLPDVARFFDLHLPMHYRPATITYLLINKPRVSPCHWFYVADSHLMLNRVAEFKNFSESDLPPETTVLCCEVTNRSRHSVNAVVAELVSTGLIRSEDVLDSTVREMPRAYPIYDLAYERHMKEVKTFFTNVPNFYHLGRNAQFAHQDVDEIYAGAKKVVDDIIARVS